MHAYYMNMLLFILLTLFANICSISFNVFDVVLLFWFCNCKNLCYISYDLLYIQQNTIIFLKFNGRNNDNYLGDINRRHFAYDFDFHVCCRGKDTVIHVNLVLIRANHT